MPNCAVVGCNSHNKMKGGGSVKFYTFPKNKNLAMQWSTACRRNDKINMKNAVVCSKHFETKCFFTPLKYKLLNETMPKRFRNLLDDSIPTLFLPKSSTTTTRHDSLLYRCMKHSTTSSTDDYQKIFIKNEIEEPLLSQEPGTSSATNYQTTVIKIEEPSVSFVEEAYYIKSEPVDPLAETEAPVNVSSDSRSSEGKIYCRLCLMPTFKFATPLDPAYFHYSGKNQAVRKKKLEEIQEIQKMIDICLPFYNPLTVNPVICPTCVTHLKNSYNFTINCLEKQQKIEEYVNTNGTLEKLVNINEIIESTFPILNVQNASYERTDITVPTDSDMVSKKNEGKSNSSNNINVDGPLVKKQKINVEPRNVNGNSDQDIRIKVEPGEDDNSNEVVAPIRKLVNINEIIESTFPISNVQNASYERTDITVPTVSDIASKKNEGKSNSSNNINVDGPLVKKQKINVEPRNVNGNSDQDIGIKVEPGEDDNSNEVVAPIRTPSRPNGKDRRKNLRTELNYKDSLDLIKTLLVSGIKVGEFENEEIDTRVTKGNISHTYSCEENPLEHKNVPPE